MTEKNHEFHTIIGQAGGNSYISEGYSNVLNFSLRLTYLMFENANRNAQQPDAYYQQIYREHEQMIDLIARRDADGLEEVGQQHTRLFCSRVSHFLQDRIPLRGKMQRFDP